jgi:alpha-tubulin suppressor-like RCC1 family protein
MAIDIENLQFPHKGYYKLGVNYSINNLVFYNGSTWEAQINQATEIPSNSSTQWVEVLKGADNIDKKIIDLYTNDLETNPLNIHKRVSSLSINNNGTSSNVHYLMAIKKIKASGYGDPSSTGAGDKTTRYLPNSVHSEDDADFVKIFSGSNAGFGLTKQGSVYSWGFNGDGQLGHGDTDNRIVASKIQYFDSLGERIVEVMPSRPKTDIGNCTFFISDKGNLYGCGINTNYILGDGTTTQRTTPIPIILNKNISGVSISAANDSGVCAWSNDGLFYVWGANLNSSLGLGNTSVVQYPILHPYMRDVKKGIITSGPNNAQTSSAATMVVLKTNGEVWSVGSNLYGQLGVGDTVNRIYFTQVTQFPQGAIFPPPIPNIDNIYMSGGVYSVVVAKDYDGRIWLWGYNGRGQIGNSGTLTKSTPYDYYYSYFGVRKIKDVVILGDRTATTVYLLSNDGDVYASGYGAYGQTGTGTANIINSLSKKVLGVKGEIAEIGGITRSAVETTESNLSRSCFIVRYKDGRVSACGDARITGATGVRTDTNSNPILTLEYVKF